jgi:hypothetical protein
MRWRSETGAGSPLAAESGRSVGETPVNGDQQGNLISHSTNENAPQPGEPRGALIEGSAATGCRPPSL